MTATAALAVLLVVPALLFGARAEEPSSGIAYVTMSDGVEIAVNVAYPPGFDAEATYPVIFEMDGYTGAGGDLDAPAGYVRLHASLRGTGCSGGVLELFSDRSARDGVEIIDRWLPDQPWFDTDRGVGIVGHSYSGLTGFFVAAQAPEHLAAVAVSGLIDDFYRGILFPGGIPNAGFPVLWGGLLRPLSEHGGNLDNLGDARCAANYVEHLGSNLLNVQGLLETIPNRAAAPGSWPLEQGAMNKIDGLTAPIQIGQQYQDEQTGPRGGHVLWEHVPEGLPKRFVVSTGRHNPSDPTGTKRDWLDCWVLHGGDPTAALGNGRTCAEVRDPQRRVLAYFESFGSDRLEPYVSSDWPLPETQWTRYHLRADGTLATDAAGGRGAVTYLSTGTGRQTTLDLGGLGPGGLGALTYGTGLPDTARYELAFDETTAVAGPLNLTLWARSTSPDFDLWAEILDVDLATGETTFVQRGMLRASFRALAGARSPRIEAGPHAGEIYRPEHPYLGRQLVVPLVPTRYDVEIFPLGHVFRAGHAMVLQVHAPPLSDPISTWLYEPNLPSVVTILQDRAHPSSLLVPVLPTLPPMRAEAPGCGQVVGEVCVTPALG